MAIVKYRTWIFDVDLETTKTEYAKAGESGAESCTCGYCANYVAYREFVFPEEIKELLQSLGIDYRKEAEIVTYDILPSQMQHIEGWFHFKGTTSSWQRLQNSVR